MEYDSEIDGLVMYKKLIRIATKILKIVIFLLILFYIIVRVTPFYSHMDREDYNYLGFKEMKENPDVLIFGSSLANCSVNPTMMYENYGITAYNLSARGQKPITTNYVIEESIKIHQPKVIVVVLDYMNDVSGSVTLNQNILTTRKVGNNDINKLLFLHQNFHNHYMEYVKYFFPVFQFHSDLIKGEMDLAEDISGNYPKYLFRKGFVKQDDIVAVDMIEKSKEQKQLSSEYVLEIRNLINQCREKQIEIVFVALPNTDNGVYLESFAQNFSDCNIIDYYDLFDSIGLDYDTDYYDDFHLNNNGAQKVSHYLSQYLLQKFELVDHRDLHENNLWDIAKIYCDEIGYDNYKTDSWKYYLDKYGY